MESGIIFPAHGRGCPIYGGRAAKSGREVARRPRFFLCRALSSKQAPGCRTGLVGECATFKNTHDHCGKEDIPSQRNPGMRKRRRKQVGTETTVSQCSAEDSY